MNFRKHVKSTLYMDWSIEYMGKSVYWILVSKISKSFSYHSVLQMIMQKKWKSTLLPLSFHLLIIWKPEIYCDNMLNFSECNIFLMRVFKYVLTHWHNSATKKGKMIYHSFSLYGKEILLILWWALIQITVLCIWFDDMCISLN